MVPPFVPFLIAALLVPALQGRARSVLVLVAPIVGAVLGALAYRFIAGDEDG